MLTKQINCMQTHYFCSSITEYRILFLRMQHIDFTSSNCSSKVHTTVFNQKIPATDIIDHPTTRQNRAFNWFRLTNDYAPYKHSELFGSFALLNIATKVQRDVRGVLFSLSFYFDTRFVNTKDEFSLRHLYSLRRTVYKNNGTFSSPMRVWRMAHVLPNHCRHMFWIENPLQ